MQRPWGNDEVSMFEELEESQGCCKVVNEGESDRIRGQRGEPATDLVW